MSAQWKAVEVGQAGFGDNLTPVCEIFTVDEHRRICEYVNEKDARRIVQAVNSHEALLDAAKCAANVLSLLEPECVAMGHKAKNILPMLRAAIEKAEGKTA